MNETVYPHGGNFGRWGMAPKVERSDQVEVANHLQPAAQVAQGDHESAVHRLNRYSEKLADLQRDGAAYIAVGTGGDVLRCTSEEQVREALGLGGAA